MIRLEGLSVSFGKKQVLKSLEGEFQDGQIIGLVAPNGVGKSTLLKAMMNYVKVKRGKVIFEENLTYRNKREEARIHALVTMLPDQFDLFDELTGLEHLRFYRRMWYQTALPIEEVIEELNMASYVKKKVKTYSLGMRQRLCFAMQRVANTKYMFMDEVMNGLDQDNVELISSILIKLKKEDKIIVVASHLLENLEKYADTVYFLKDGQFVHTYKKEEDKDLSYIKTRRLPKNLPECEYHVIKNGLFLIPLEAETASAYTACFLEESIPFEAGNLSLTDLYYLYFH